MTRRLFPFGATEWVANTLSMRERAMLTVIDMLSDKEGWTRKIKDAAIVAKWKAELDAVVEQGDEPFNTGFSEQMWEQVLFELGAKAAVFDKTGIMAVYDGAAAVFKADNRISTQLLEDLRAAAAAFEDVPDSQKDWHPGSDGKVLDLVHPSLFPIVNNKTIALENDRPLTLDTCLAAIGSGKPVDLDELEPKVEEYQWAGMSHWSDRFCWLASPVRLSPEGEAKFTSYINNAHPVKHAALYPVIEGILSAALPMVDAAYRRCMAWNPDKPWDVSRMAILEEPRTCTVPERCEHGCYRSNCLVDEDNYAAGLAEWASEYSDEDDWFDATHPIGPPLEPETPYAMRGHCEYRTTGPWLADQRESPDNSDTAIAQDSNDGAAAGKSTPSPVPDTDQDLRVIVKLANIHLTPDKPTYDGGSWHFEGMGNEGICATVLYYYDVENVTESRLSFRSAMNAEGLELSFPVVEADRQNPRATEDVIVEMYGFDYGLEDSLCEQDIGSVATCAGRLLVFPNVMQHRVSPFELVDKTRPGHRKIVALFIVDPARKILTTAEVPPQQKSWMDTPTLPLPRELSDIVYDSIECPYGLPEAKELREELMQERSERQTDEDNYGFTERSWNFCEH